MSTRFTSFCGGILALFPILATADDRVIDDAAMSKDFSHKLGAMVDKGQSICGKTATEGLKKSLGKKIALPAQPKPCAMEEGKSIYETCVPAVVAVGSVYKCGKCDDWHLGGFATGWILSPDGLMVTNHHVLEKDSNNTIGVMTADGEVYAVKEVVAADDDGDAAIFRVDTRGQALPYLRLADHATPGEEITVISHPKGRFYTLSEGVVSRLHRQKAKGDSVWMSITADYAVGSSGGPVLNANGEVAGMVSSTVSANAGPPKVAKPKGKDAPPVAISNQQMVFKDCVSLQTLRGLFQP